MFVIITAALITGAVAGRMKFPAWMLFASLWALLVYPVVAHWTWEGWLGGLGAIDFAGGPVVHINAGVAALALVAVLGSQEGIWEGQMASRTGFPCGGLTLSGRVAVPAGSRLTMRCSSSRPTNQRLEPLGRPFARWRRRPIQ